MRLELTGRHVEITPELRALVEKRVAKLDRLLAGGVVSVQAVLTLEKYRHQSEFTVHARGDHFLHGIGHTNTWESSVGDAIEKITQQLAKVKGKWQERKRRGAPVRLVQGRLSTPRAGAARPAPRRVRGVEPYPVKPMTIDEAALALEAGDAAFLVFRNAATDAIGVVYRRKDGRLGLIEPER
jgi:putative sigma-54 modulation protein